MSNEIKLPPLPLPLNSPLIAEHAQDYARTAVEADRQGRMRRMGAPVQYAASAEPVYAFRRKGQDEFVTCGPERFAELQAKPRLFETRIFYTAPVAQEPCARLHITSTDTYPDIDIEVLDGSLLQPSMSPVNVYAARAAEG